MTLPHEIEAAFGIEGALIFRRRCLCGLMSGWQDSPEAAEADRPTNCAAHDEHAHDIATCPACNVQWEGRKVGDGAQLIAQHMTLCIRSKT